MPTPIAYHLDAVTMRFAAHTVLDGVSFEIRRGERVALIGPSGAGKTTLLRVMAGIYRPTSGTVTVGESRERRFTQKELRAVRRKTGFIHQSLDLVPELRVVSNVIAGRLGYWNVFQALRALVWPRMRDLEGVHAALEKVGLVEKMYARTDTLSGGQAQRVAVARVLFQDPDAILADEPVSAVDPARARDLMTLLREINETTGKPIVISIHAVDLAREFCTRVIGLRDGKIAFDKKTADLTPESLTALYALEARGGGDGRA